MKQRIDLKKLDFYTCKQWCYPQQVYSSTFLVLSQTRVEKMLVFIVGKKKKLGEQILTAYKFLRVYQFFFIVEDIMKPILPHYHSGLC